MNTFHAPLNRMRFVRVRSRLPNLFISINLFLFVSLRFGDTTTDLIDEQNRCFVEHVLATTITISKINYIFSTGELETFVDVLVIIHTESDRIHYSRVTCKRYSTLNVY